MQTSTDERCGCHRGLLLVTSGLDVGLALFNPLHKHDDVTGVSAGVAWPQQNVGRLQFVPRAEAGAHAGVEIVAAATVQTARR